MISFFLSSGVIILRLKFETAKYSGFCCFKPYASSQYVLQDMNGSYCTMSGAGNGAPDTTTESVINHLGDNKGPASGMLRKDNSPIFGRSSIVNRGNTAMGKRSLYFRKLSLAFKLEYLSQFFINHKNQ